MNVKTATLPREPTDQMWSSTGSCIGTVNLSPFDPGEGRLIVVATDLFLKSGQAEQTIILNRYPEVALVSDGGSVVSPGDLVTLDVEVDDDDFVDGDEVEVWVEDDSGAVVDSTTCGPLASHGCMVALVSPTTSGTYTIVAEHTDPHAAGARAELPLVVDAEPTIALAADLAGAYLEQGDTLTLTLTISDPDLLAAPDAADVSVSLAGAATGSLSCDAMAGSAGLYTCTIVATPVGNGYSEVDVVYDDGTGRGPFGASYAFLMQRSTTIHAEVETVFVDPHDFYTVYFDLDDEDPFGGVFTVTVTDLDTGDAYVNTLGMTAYASGFQAFEMADHGALEVVFTFVDSYGYTFTSEVLQVYGNTAPAVGLIDPAVANSTIQATKLDDDPSDGIDTRLASWSFDVDDVDVYAPEVYIDTLTVVPDDGLPAPASCTHEGDGRGVWECEVDVRDWAIADYPFSVTVSDGWETTSVGLSVRVVGDDDYDYDGDGVTWQDYLDATYLGFGDCEPDNAEVYGAGVGPSGEYLYPATEVCDWWDNDCDGEVNETAPDADDDTRDEATPYVEGDASGNLHNDQDEDWWSYEVADDGSGVRNAAFSASLTVPDDGTGAPDGSWRLDAWAWTPEAPTNPYGDGVPTDRSPVVSTTDCDGSGWCSITWEVASSTASDGEIRWWIGVHSDAGWTAAMCADDAVAPTYFLEIVE